MKTTVQLGLWVQERMEARNQVMEPFFAREAERLATACREMSERFLRGGRLLAFGRGPQATDAQHVAVEFVHPVIVGKRALSALDLSSLFPEGLEALLQPEDMVMGFGPAWGDPVVEAALENAGRRGAMTFALPGQAASYAVETGEADPFLHQEMIEVLYHTLWETVHVFLEHRELGLETGEAGFLYPFLGQQKQETDDVLEQVAGSIRMKAGEDSALRSEVGAREGGRIAEAAGALLDRVRRGGRLLMMGNGGSATDANDFAMDCLMPPPGYEPIPALSLAMEPAVVTAIGNDVGMDVVFLRQLIAQAQPQDAVIALSTSGGSRNLRMALQEARRRGLLTVALLGYDGGEILRSGLADFPVVVRSDYIPRIQEVQASIYHTLIDCMERMRREPS